MPVILCLLISVLPASAEDAPGAATEAPGAIEDAAEEDAAGETAAEVKDLYLGALALWEQGRILEARQLCGEALAIDPMHRPSLLLYGYALIRRGFEEEGAAVLSALGTFPADTSYEERIQRQARQISNRYLSRMTRETTGLSLGVPLIVERRWDGIVVRSAFLGQIQRSNFPGAEHLLLRGDVLLQPAGSALSIDGGRYALLAGGQIPVGSGLWHLDAAAGPVLWSAQGPYWPDQQQIWLGARVAAGADWRFSQGMSFRQEVGWTWWPGAQADLEWFDQPLDLRFSLVWWMPDTDNRRYARGG